MTADPPRSPIGRWFCRRSLSQKGGKRLRHLISTTSDNGGMVACCGVHLRNPVASDMLGPWNPEDHLDITCPDCLKWWRDMQPKPGKVDEAAREKRKAAEV